MKTASDPSKELLRAVPRLRAFAISLSGNVTQADDLVQDTLVRAWANMDSFEPGSNFLAWLYTILRNHYYSECRKRRREVADSDGFYASKLASRPTQESHMDFQDFRAAMKNLAVDHREALILVGASGLSYEEAAKVCGCAVGTMKSRVNRARQRLASLLSVSPDGSDGLGPGWEATAGVPASTVVDC